ncbi:12888_t:CDS:2 [Funneliformis geosporum]|uniref:12888_t:CDS:1 n=1 Tax=Funneliformis geosporum TaxID=1117311 RepID=A0A9W4XAD2_9GLOM|nr:12888_t:CDS:2 [Funneliformis geosporum]
MPNINQNQETKYRKPTTIDREQLEYTISKTLTYSVLIFAAVGTCASELLLAAIFIIAACYKLSRISYLAPKKLNKTYEHPGPKRFSRAISEQLPNTYILKIAEQKFIGFVRSDKKGESYWKFRSFYDDSEPSTPASSPAEIEVNQPLKPLSDYSKEELDRRAKFLERQERAERLAAEKENHASHPTTT